MICGGFHCYLIHDESSRCAVVAYDDDERKKIMQNL